MTEGPDPLAGRIAAAARPLPDPADPAFGAAFDRFGACRVVLLGEATHGTSEFYRARAAITRRLVERHGFTIVAVEADWPDAAAIDRHIRHRPPREAPEPPFTRFPRWMWRNAETAALVAWLRQHNAGREADDRVAFHGLDLYSLSGSIAAVLAYLDRIDPDAASAARARYGCLSPWQADPARYGHAVLTRRHRDCEAEVVAQLTALLERQLDYAAKDGAEDGAEFLDAAQNARLIRSAEGYYKAMYEAGAEGWNLRDRHMAETLEQVLAARGPGAKAVVWAHNSHVGDARATAMGAEGELTLGQLARDTHGDAAALIGFGTHSGTVAAAADWGGAMEVMRLRPALPGSHEALCHAAGLPRFLLDFAAAEDMAEAWADPRPERFVGVVYRPQTERASHYADAVLPRQFDGWVWFDETAAITPLAADAGRAAEAETWPFGL